MVEDEAVFSWCEKHMNSFPQGGECSLCAGWAPPKRERDPNGLEPHQPGAKCDHGKRRADLLLGFSRALEAVADVLTHGAAKYSPNSWKSVPDGVERYTAAMLRHLLAEGRGEERDPDSGLRHAAQVAWNALARLELMLQEEEAKP
jgi:hypothetical protein